MKVRGLARKEERSHNQPAKGDVILGQVHTSFLMTWPRTHLNSLLMSKPIKRFEIGGSIECGRSFPGQLIRKSASHLHER